MSKTSKRKAGDSSKSNISSTSKDYQKRPSVFERLGTKASNISSTTTTLSVNVSNQESFCRNWAQTGNCPYGKSCKLSNTHTLISPSKRSSKKEGESKQGRSEEKRIHSNLTRRVSPEVNWETWDQTDLEYEDEKALEKRRQLLQRELELQMKKETRKQDPAKRRCSSTSSCSSSTSGSTSTSGSSSESSVSTLRRNELKKKRQSTSSPSESERTLKKNMVKGVMHKDSPARKSTGNKKLSPSRKPNRRKSPSPPSSRKPLSPPKQKPTLSVSGGGGSSSRRRESPSSRRGASLERKSSSQHRSSSRNRRGRSPKSRPRPRTPESKPPRAAALPPPPSLITSRNRSSDRKKDDDRKGSKDDSGRRDRKSDFRDKRDQDEGRRSREKAREIREAAREKERLEALERCRERQREREQAKEKERAREERERERAKRDRERRDRRGTSRERRRPAGSEDKRHDRIYDRYERKVGERERSYERERARDRALERVMETKSADRNRDRSRESYDRSYETRRIIQEEKPYNSPFRGNDRGRSNYETERERERVGSQEIRTSTGYNSAGESERRSRRDRQTWDNSGGSYQDSQRDKRDWEQRDYHDSSREWDNRSRCRGDDGGDEWPSYNTGGGGGGGGSDWHSGRSHLLPIPHHEERRTHHANEISEKEPTLNDSVKEKEPSDAIKRVGRGSGDEMEEVTKRPRVDEPPPLEEELSDISDDADDILNREDVEFEESVVMEERRINSAVAEEESEPSVQEPQLNQPHEDSATTVGGANGTGALTDDEHIDSLDFEEISDDELEEEAKVNKGSSVGDALGVDWASLMAECRPQRKQQASSAHTFWNTANILARIGVSFHMANAFVYNNIKQKYNLMLDKDQELTQVAGLQRALVDKKQRRATLVSSALEHKQALSARSDISVRRQLCGLPVVSLESHQTAGFCQWAV